MKTDAASFGEYKVTYTAEGQRFRYCIENLETGHLLECSSGEGHEHLIQPTRENMERIFHRWNNWWNKMQPTPEFGKERVEILSRVQKLMKWDETKAILWYQSENPLLGSVTPETLVNRGRGYKVLKFVEAAERDNAR